MTQDERQLLLIDLCGRLRHGVKFASYDNIPIVEYCVCNNVFIHEQGYVIIELLDKDSNGNTLASTSINLTTVSRLPKPYLRSMSSMTEEEKNELRQEHVKDEKLYAECLTKASNGDNSMRGKVILHFAADWCNKNHFDYRGLIPMGLALEAPEGMYND